MSDLKKIKDEFLTKLNEKLTLLEINEIKSIFDLESQNKVSNFELENSIKIGNYKIKSAIVGTDKKDKITGTSKAEVLAGREGKDVLQGGLGSDGFLFQEPAPFGKKKADKITDFDSNEGDSILVDKSIFGFGKKFKLKAVRSIKEFNKALKTKYIFVYHEKKGLLYFNENGKEQGLGNGGLLAKLQGAPNLTSNNLEFI